MSAFIGELVGTMILIIFGGGVVAGVVLNKSKAQNSGWIVITLGWGLAVAIAVYAVGGISGAHINPAVTIGLAAVGEFPWSQVPLYVIAQFLGAFLGAVIVWLHYYPHWRSTQDKGAKLAVFSTDPAIKHTPSNLISEIIGTFTLLFCLLAIGANQFTEGLNPLIVGFLIVAIGLSLGGTTGYAINPARDLGPRIAHFLLPIPGKGDSNWGYAWIPVIGPLIGGVLGAYFYKLVFENGSSGAVIGFVAALTILALFVRLRSSSVGDEEKKMHGLSS
ncbi:MIP family channel protein [Caldalkalibacillus thermarum TA2.A1]|uniref:Aquaporin family protein n=1 Tax=Caldalkalibacillus thermarum (strain TA2.A1) TaxID=986075 RepID=F5L768_CALTT|nr:MIP/aquaporin family protein [Caldalkalibacillus thermarum]EGL82844.1 MIP family channel protein [Caldalkalibacillus thermarum TA2.A1]QZT34852.1 aquaporin family protein [Caldalkalibacillus thermarum TA2.A1]